MVVNYHTRQNPNCDNHHTFFSIFTDILKGVGGLKGVDFQNFL